MIGNTTAAMEQLTERVVAWASGRSDVRAVVMAGSRARTTDRPADQFSDLDLLLVADDPAVYQRSARWVNEIGDPVVTFLEGTITGTKERRVLFAGALDVDFNFMPTVALKALNRYMWLKRRLPILVNLLPRKMRHEADTMIATIGGVVRRGVRVLLDKDGLTRHLADTIPEKAVRTLPTEEEALNTIGDFWYHTLWTARKLQRGELLVAKQCCDGRLKRYLVDATEAQALAEHGPEYDTWHDWRFFEQWADPSVVAELHRVYAHYDRDDIARALLATMEVFDRVVRDAMSRMGYAYPQAMVDQVTAYVRECLGESASVSG